jgi:hypothetical protein
LCYYFQIFFLSLCFLLIFKIQKLLIRFWSIVKKVITGGTSLFFNKICLIHSFLHLLDSFIGIIIRIINILNCFNASITVRICIKLIHQGSLFSEWVLFFNYILGRIKTMSPCWCTFIECFRLFRAMALPMISLKLICILKKI